MVFQKTVSWSIVCSRNFSTFGQRIEPTKILKKVTHCIFDLDGTLVNSEIKYHAFVRELVKKYGANYTHELEHKMYGSTDRDVCIKVAKILQLKVPAETLEAELKSLSKKSLPDMPLQKGVNKLLQHLHSVKIPMAIATNASREVLDLHEKFRPKIFSLFQHKVCKADVSQVKPHPEIYLLAAKMFPDSPHPKDCLVFEDSLTGVKAGIAAGMQVVMITNRDTSICMDPNTLGNPTMIITTLLDFKPELFGLPPFKDS